MKLSTKIISVLIALMLVLCLIPGHGLTARAGSVTAPEETTTDGGAGAGTGTITGTGEGGTGSPLDGPGFGGGTFGNDNQNNSTPTYSLSVSAPSDRFPSNDVITVTAAPVVTVNGEASAFVGQITWSCTPSDAMTLSPSSDGKTCTVTRTADSLQGYTVTATWKVDGQTVATKSVSFLASVTIGGESVQCDDYTVSYSPRSLSFDEAGQQKTITVTAEYSEDSTMYGDDMEYEVEWSVEPSGVVTVENGVVTAVANGSATVKGIVREDGIFWITDITVPVTVDIPDNTGDGPTGSTDDNEGDLEIVLAWENSSVTLDNKDDTATLKATFQQVYDWEAGTVDPYSFLDEESFLDCFKWESDNPDVVSVNSSSTTGEYLGDDKQSPIENVVTAKADSGSANIYISFYDPDTDELVKKSPACKVTIGNPVEEPVTAESINLEINGSDTLWVVSGPVDLATLFTVTVTPSNADTSGFKWSVVDSKVATISDGKLVPKKYGIAKVTLTDENSGLTATATVKFDKVHCDSVKPSSAKWVQGSKDDMVFHIKCEYSTADLVACLTEVSVDGKTLTEDTQYTKSNGSVNVSLKPDYLKGLSKGSHKFKATFSIDGITMSTEEVPFKVVAPSTGSGDGSKTNDTTPYLGLNAFLFIISLAFVASYFIRMRFFSKKAELCAADSAADASEASGETVSENIEESVVEDAESEK